MDGGLIRRLIHRFKNKGSAFLALPLLLVAVSAWSRDSFSSGPVVTGEASHLDGGSRWIFAKAEALDAMSASLGFPSTGSQFLLWGGGATISKPQMRMGVSGFTGGLSARSGQRATGWDLQLATLTMEQRYDYGSFVVTAGANTDYGYLTGRLEDGADVTYVQVPLFGGGVNTGFRWPAQTKMSFFTRVGYSWLQGNGEWRGKQGTALGTKSFDLQGLNITAQVELSL